MIGRSVGNEGTRVRRAPYETLPLAESGEVHAWAGYPPDDERYETFVADLLGHLSRWLGVPVTNGIIDYTSPTERSAARGLATYGGWIDPSLEHVGSASRESILPEVIQDSPCHVTLRRREFSLITLDAPTSFAADESRSFYTRVIEPLVNLPPRRDHLYAWLDVMFRFCADKTVGYYSRYAPGPRIRAIAGRYEASVIYLPLQTIPTRLVEQNQQFRFLWLTERQWKALEGADDLKRGRAAPELHEG